MTPEMREAREIALERDRAKAALGWKRIKMALKLFGAVILLSFVYFAGEFAGVQMCQTFRKESK